MKKTGPNFFNDNPEGAIIVALDSRNAGLLFGAVELRGGDEVWMEYEMGLSSECDMVSLYRTTSDTPPLEYRTIGRKVEIVTPPDRLLIFWNHGSRTLFVDGKPLPPGKIAAFAPEEGVPWLLRFANWLPNWRQWHS